MTSKSIQIKTIMRFYLIRATMFTLQKSIHNACIEDMGKQHPIHCWWIMETSMETPQKYENVLCITHASHSCMKQWAIPSCLLQDEI